MPNRKALDFVSILSESIYFESKDYDRACLLHGGDPEMYPELDRRLSNIRNLQRLLSEIGGLSNTKKQKHNIGDLNGDREESGLRSGEEGAG